MKKLLLVLTVFSVLQLSAQPVNLTAFKKGGAARVSVKNNLLTLTWPAGNANTAQMVLNLQQGEALFNSIKITKNGGYQTIVAGLDPAFVLTVGKRDLVSQNGWNIFFDKVPNKPFKSFPVVLSKQSASVTTSGAQTIVHIDTLQAGSFSGALEITVYNGSPMFNVAAVMATTIDSTAILYDAGLTSNRKVWQNIAWSNTSDQMQSVPVETTNSAHNVAVKYRTIIGENNKGSFAIFPAPHQFFYPLDEAFNLRFTWYGSNYRGMVNNYGMGIRQDPYGDRRFVPWFNAPPNTQQRLNFFCMLSASKPTALLADVKKLTHNDAYVRLPGYKTMASHFHNEFIMSVVLKGTVPEHPNFVKVFKNTGVDIVHLGEFHYTAHPKGPDSLRLKELQALFQQCKRLSDKDFLLLPGEEPNEFFGGHWMQFFPKPVYWIMSRKPGMPFVATEPGFGKVYRVNNKDEMLRLLQTEKGLAWTAHARTKGSTGYPDAYKTEPFFLSDRFMGAAWKAIPADLSKPRLSQRVFDLLDDMNNWGLKKHVIAEADLFTVEPENEMYAHLNINYLQLKQLPRFSDGWQQVLTAMEKGQFFSSTGEVLLPSFAVNGKGAGETLQLDKSGKANVAIEIDWTFPLCFAEIISGDGTKVYRHRIELNNTKAFGHRKFNFPVNLSNRKWVRVEVWDAAVNGAYTQTVYLK